MDIFLHRWLKTETGSLACIAAEGVGLQVRDRRLALAVLGILNEVNGRKGAQEAQKAGVRTDGPIAVSKNA